MKELLNALLGTETQRPPIPGGKEVVILQVLSERGERYGLDMVKQSGGVLKRGSIYVTLGRMEEKGYVRSWLEAEPPAGRPRRRLYEISAHGRRVLRTWEVGAAGLQAEWLRGSLQGSS